MVTYSRRQLLWSLGGGLGGIALSWLLQQDARADLSPYAPKPAQFTPKARRIIQMQQAIRGGKWGQPGYRTMEVIGPVERLSDPASRSPAEHLREPESPCTCSEGVLGAKRAPVTARASRADHRRSRPCS